MDDNKEIITQIEMLGLSITEDTYSVMIQQGYEFLVKLHDSGMEKDSVYQTMLQYHNSLDDGLLRDYIADLMDFVVGWCSPIRWIWKE